MLSPKESNPSVVYTPYMEDVIPLTVEILKTGDKSLPKQVKLGIFGCADPMKLNTKAQIEPDTTTTPSPSLTTVSGQSTTSKSG